MFLAILPMALHFISCESLRVPKRIGQHAFFQNASEEIWHGEAADRIRLQVRGCTKNCWMVGSVAHKMKKHIWEPGKWVHKHKFLSRQLCPQDC